VQQASPHLDESNGICHLVGRQRPELGTTAKITKKGTLFQEHYCTCLSVKFAVFSVLAHFVHIEFFLLFVSRSGEVVICWDEFKDMFGMYLIFV